MRIGLVVPGFSADAADWCIPALRHLARALAAGDEVRVFALRYPHRVDRYTIEGAEVITLGGAERRGIATATVWRRALSAIAAEHSRRRFDVLHAFWATESGLVAAVAGRMLRVPTLVSLAGGELVALRDIGYGDQRVAWERFKVRGSLRLASAVSVGSHLLMMLAKWQVGADRLHRAPLGVDTRLFTPVGETTNPGRYLHVGTLTRVKDQTTLLKAFALLPRGAKLEIVGSGPLRPELERLAHDLGITDDVHFRGEVDHASLPSIYRGALAFVLSSRHEAQGMVALEAAACGVPVVGTFVGVLPELTTSAVPVGGVEALAHALGERAPTALDTATREFSLEVCTDRFRALYAGLT